MRWLMDPLVLGFLAGAPVWASLGVALFGSLNRCHDCEAGRPLEGVTEASLRNESSALTPQLIARLRARHDPDVVDLATERLRRRGGNG